MKVEKIVVSYFNFISIEKLEINQAVGEHAAALLRGSIQDEDVEKYRILLMEKIWVKIEAEDEGGEKRILMTGIIAGFSLERLQHIYVLELVLKSGTFLMDGRQHFRSFQDGNLTFLDVMKMVNSGYACETGIIAENSLNAGIDFLLQYSETDWEFIKRIASRFGIAVTPSVVQEGIFYYVGMPHYISHMVDGYTDSCSGKYIDHFMKCGANGMGSLQEQDYVEYCVSTRKIFGLWDYLTAGEQRGHICRIHSEYSQGEMVHSYWLRSDQGLRVLQSFNESQQGCSFQAVVNAVMQDKVQIVLCGDENKKQRINRWFPYSTGYSSPDGAGWYCMPEIGDRVRLQIPDHREESGYVISSVHMETDGGRKIPDHKSFKTRFGKELLFTPDSLELTNNQGMCIKIVDGEGIQIMSDKDISIIAGGSMTISSEEDSLIIAGTESVDVRQGGAGLHIDENIVFSGGKFRIQ
ncbi:MAG: hypothetical protein HFI58_04420 [Lachnospiraceae bacterium]|jgi:hypothetical protein|nr:hypothetical protein [Lachnospiraceae bacterium]